MFAWRPQTFALALLAAAPTAGAQSTPTTPAPVPVVSPSGLSSGVVNTPVVNRPRLEKPSRAGSLELTWLGHAAWVLRAPSGTTVLIDPWLANPRAPADFVMPTSVDAILVTHAHADHLGQAVELSKKLHAPIVASFELIEQLGIFGISNGIGTNPGGTTKIKDLSIHATTAIHSSSLEVPPPPFEHEHEMGCPCHKGGMPASLEQKVDSAVEKALDKRLPSKKGKGQKGKAAAEKPSAPSEPAGCTCGPHHPMPAPHPHFAYSGAAMGFVIAMDNGPTVYHAGDTDVFGDMMLINKRYHPKIGLLPIGGMYGMDPAGAAIASHLLGVNEVLPMHYGTMPQLSGTPTQLQEALQQHKRRHKHHKHHPVRVVAPNPGARVSYLP